MTLDNLLKELRDLEIRLHQREVRSNVEQLDALLHDSFVEFGRSGQCYNKAEIIEQLLLESATKSVWSQDFTVEEISAGVALLLYKSAHRHETGALTRHANRSSLWQLTDRGWQLRFHQGTATAEFVASAT